MKNLKTYLILQILFATIIYSQCKGREITNFELRSCLDDATLEEEEGYCFNALKSCFDVKSCADEFQQIFFACEIPLDDETFDSSCLVQGRDQTQDPLTQKLVKCFDDYCGMFGGDHLANIQGIIQKQKEIENSQKAKIISDPNLPEESVCIKQVITDINKCGRQAQECDEYCQDDLEQIRSCEGNDDEQCTFNINAKDILLQNEQAKSLKECFIQHCKIVELPTEQNTQKTSEQLHEDL